MCNNCKVFTIQRRAVFDALLRCAKPTRLSDIYAFISGPSNFKNSSPKLRLLNEYFRLLGRHYHQASTTMIEDGSFALSNELWRISSVNSKYTMCQSYPFALVVPKCIRYDNTILIFDTTRWYNLFTVAY